MRTTIAILMLALALNLSVNNSQPLAATRQTEDFAEMLKLADCIVDVSVLSTKAETTSSLGMPRTVVGFKVNKCYKGSLPAGSTATCEIFGGSNGTETVVVPGQAHLTEGDSAMLLLTNVKGQWRVLGGDIGHVAYYRNEKNAAVAKREAGQFDLYVADKKSLTGYTEIRGGVINAEQVGMLVEAVLSTGKPVIEKASAIAAAPAQPAPAAAVTVSAVPANTPASKLPFAAVALLVAVASLGWVLVRRRS